MPWSGRNPVARHDPVAGQRPRAVGQLHAPVRCRPDALHRETRDELDGAGVDDAHAGACRARRAPEGRRPPPPPYVRAALAARIAHTTVGAGHLSRELGQEEKRVGGRMARPDDDGALAGEAVAVRAQDVGQRVLEVRGAASSPVAGMPDAPRTLGEPQVPEASITARARMSSPPARRTRNGVSSRPAVRSRSSPSRVTAATRAP